MSEQKPTATAVADVFKTKAPVIDIPATSSQSMGTALTVPEPVSLSAITEASLLPESNLPQEVLDRIVKRQSEITFDNPTFLLTYGKGNQDGIDKVLDELLTGVKTEDIGVVSGIMIELKSGLSEMKVEELKKELDQMGNDEFSWRKAFRKIPGLGRVFSHVENFMEQKEAIVKKFAVVRQKAEGRMVAISDGQTRINILAKKRDGYLQELVIDILAGQRALAAKQAEFEVRRTAFKSNDPREAGNLRELSARLVQFDTRLCEMKVAFTDVAVVDKLQNLMTEEAGNIEMNNLMNVVMFHLPHLKRIILGVANEIAIKRAQMDGKAILEAERKATEASLQLLNDVYTAAKRSQGNAKTHADLLSHVVDELSKTLAQGEAIDKTTAEQRREVEQTLLSIKERATKAMAGNNTGVVGTN